MKALLMRMLFGKVKKMAKMKRIFLLLFLLLSMTITSQAQVLMGRDYYDVVKQHIVSAKDSINIAMYFVIIDDKSDNPVNDLVDEVILAHQRGVNVKFGYRQEECV